MSVPPINFDTGLIPADKRVTARLHNYWEYIKEDRPFPSEDEIKPEAISEIWDNCFIVEANNYSKREDYKYKYVGKKIVQAYGQELNGINVDAMVSPNAQHLADEYEKILAMKRPILDEKIIPVADGKEIRYRQILLPLGENGINITSILGGMSYKVFD